MFTDILTRSIFSLGLILSGLGLYLLYNWTLKFRTANLHTDLGPVRPYVFTLVYFTTPGCVPCKTIQRPAIQQLIQLVGSSLHVIEIDATEQPELASRWGVLSVPTTFLIDPHGKLRHVNHGVTRAEKLLMQLHDVK